MRNFKDYLSEEDKNPLIAQFQKSLEPIFRKQFPNGFFNVSSTALSDGKSIWVVCGVIDKLADETNHIRQNDPLTFTFNINLLDEETYELLNRHGISFSVKPKKQFMAMGQEKVSFRKTTGDEKKIAVAVERTMKKVRAKFDEILKIDDLFKQDLRDIYKK